MSQTPPPALTPTPTPAPQRNDRATFSNRVDAFITWMTTGVGEFSAIATNVYNNAVDAFNNAVAAAASALTASNAATTATTAANNATNASNASGTSTSSVTIPSSVPTSISFTTQTGKNFGVGQTIKLVSTTAPNNWLIADITSYNSGTGAMVANTVATQGTGTYTSWNVVLTGPVMAPVSNAVSPTKTATFNITATDRGMVFPCTGTYSVTADAAATLGSGHYVYIANDGTGVITFDPNGSETINGVSTLAIQPGEALCAICDGSKFKGIKTPAVPGLNHLATVTPSAASSAVDFLTIFSALYDNYEIVVNGVSTTGGGNDSLTLRVAVAGAADSGSNYWNGSFSSGTATTTTTYFQIINGSSSNASAIVNLQDVNSSNVKVLQASGGGKNGANLAYTGNVGGHNSVSAITGFRLFWASSSTFNAAGTITVYGYRKQ